MQQLLKNIGMTTSITAKLNLRQTNVFILYERILSITKLLYYKQNCNFFFK